jgi:hypothetical protein
LTGQAAGLFFNRLLAAAQGSFTLTGYDADLVYSGGIAPLVAEYKSFALTGQASGFLFTRLLTAEQGSFSLAGQAAGLLYYSGLQIICIDRAGSRVVFQ